MQPSTLAKRVYLLLFLAIIVFYFYGLGHLPLVGPDEPRYAQVAREMFLRSDLITPTLGGHTWFEKPALLYWMMIAAFKAFGVSEWSARLGPAISGLLTIAAVAYVSRGVARTSSQHESADFSLFAFSSPVVAATSLGVVAFSRGASFDIVITMTATWALSFFLLHELAAPSLSRPWCLVAFYVAVGLSLLAKGLVGIVIPFGVIGLYYVLRREWPSRRVWLSLVWGVPLAIAISAVWYAPVISRHGWHFVDEFFIQHHFARYISNKFHHPQPVYFYPVVLVLLTLPWTGFLLDALAHVRSRQWRADDGLNKMRVFALAWLVLPILFFSFSGSKLPGYVLPVLPATALLIGDRLSLAPATSRWALRLTGLICFALAVVGVFYASRSHVVSLRYAALAGSPMVIAGVCSFINRLRVAIVPIVAIATLLMVVVVLNCAAYKVARSESVRDLLRAADARGYSQAPVFARRGYDRTAEFYASGRVVYGADEELVELDEVPQILIEANKQQRPILVFVPMENLPHLKGTPSDGKVIFESYGKVPGALMEIIGDNSRVVLIGVGPYTANADVDRKTR